jgi:hypothetical protein
MRKLALLMVGGLLILAACIPTTPAPLTIPQTGGSPVPGQTGTAGEVTGTDTAGGVTGTGQPGGSLTIVPPSGTETGQGDASGTLTPGAGGENTMLFTATPGGDQTGQGTGTGTALPGAGQGTGTGQVTGTAVPGTGTGTAVPGTGQVTGTAVPGTGQGTGTGTPPVSGIPQTDPQPTQGVPQTTRVVDDTDYSYNTFLGELRGQSGLTLEEGGMVQEPFFSVGGRQVRINNADVTLFEFPDRETHQTALATITENGGIIGAITPYWGARPNFFTRGNLIALYVGNDEATLNMLRDRFGEPVTYTNQVGGLTADTAFRLQSRLSDRFNVGLDQIRIIDVSQQNWPDACLGLAGQNENCAQVMTPGYSITVEVGGVRYNVRTNQTATLLRFQQQ